MHKTLSISQKNQITIPAAFLKELGFKDKAECFVSGGQIIIKPVKDTTGEYFSDEILADLIDEGYEGIELLSKFKEQKQKIPAAVEKMISDSRQNAKEMSMEELFDEI